MVKAAAWTPLAVHSKLCITGGFCPTKSHVLDSRVISHGNRDISFVQVGSSASWLCEVAAQQHATRRPLARVEVFELLRKAVCGSAVAADGSTAVAEAAIVQDKMVDLAFEVEPGESPPVAKKSRRQLPAKTRGPVVCELFAQDYSADVKEFRVVNGSPGESAVADCPGPSAVADANLDERRFFVAVDGSKLYIEVNALSWFVAFVKAELESGGVRPIVRTDTGHAKQLITWDFRDESWVFRTRASGKVQRKSKPVRRLMAPGKQYANLSFEEARQAVLADFVEECGCDA